MCLLRLLERCQASLKAHMSRQTHKSPKTIMFQVLLTPPYLQPLKFGTRTLRSDVLFNLASSLVDICMMYMHIFRKLFYGSGQTSRPNSVFSNYNLLLILQIFYFSYFKYLFKKKNKVKQKFIHLLSKQQTTLFRQSH